MVVFRFFSVGFRWFMMGFRCFMGSFGCFMVVLDVSRGFWMFIQCAPSSHILFFAFGDISPLLLKHLLGDRCENKKTSKKETTRTHKPNQWHKTFNSDLTKHLKLNNLKTTIKHIQTTLEITLEHSKPKVVAGAALIAPEADKCFTCGSQRSLLVWGSCLARWVSVF